MEVTTTIQVKVAFNEDIRRFSLLRDASFKQLADNITTLYGINSNVPIVVKYYDMDKDLITMSSDAELQEAFAIVQKEGILRVIVLTVNKSLPPASFHPLASAPSVDEATQGLEDLSVHSSGGIDPSAPVFYPRWGVPHPHHPAHGDGFAFGGPHRGGHHHYRGGHHPYAGPFGFPPHHGRGSFGGAPFPPPAGEAPAAPFYGPGGRFNKEERMRWKEENMQAWKDHKKMMKTHWREMNKEDREKLKEHKKEMKRYWKGSKEDGDCSSKGNKLVARHVKDVTIEDGTELAPNTPFVKTWKLRNEGEAWPAGCSLLFISRKGDRMGGPDSVPLPVEGLVQSGQEVVVSVNLVAPAEPGRYTSYYKLATPEGVKFGQRMWVSIMVTGLSSSSSSSDDESKYGAVAGVIEAMGFNVKRKHILRLLGKHNGDVDKVVRVLAKKDKGCKDKK